MCRMVSFSGTCVRCGAYYTVPQLNQSVSCLEAKNNGGFGDCRRGVNYDQHDPGLECGPCSAALGADGASDELLAASGSPMSYSSSSRGSSSSSSSSSTSSSGKSSSGGARHASSKHESGKRRRVR
ncbi:hypothetical protein BD289DRAFT_479640 [Coniella lustricola]|uniref:Uncharacterized protein n=1 Tax=Coniella lustricola TaxID=2025994 RepID=A0A2T3AII9_9PEZI|nr:hypothetical protein BD289DRAFT_479640 [Coniella lustricola]